MKNNLKISVRLDDICSTMNWSNFNKVMGICEKHNIKPLLGIIPCNEDPKLIIDETRTDFFEIMQKYQKSGCGIAQHGFDHLYKNKKGGILKVNKKSDIVGLSKDEQRLQIEKGFNILKANNLNTNIYMAPSHSYDKNTVLALKELGFNYITDGYTDFCYEWKGIKFIPCKDKYFFKENTKGIRTCCLHTNTMKEKDIEDFEQMLITFKDNLCDYSKLLNEPAKKHFKFQQFMSLSFMKFKRGLVKIIKRR